LESQYENRITGSGCHLFCRQVMLRFCSLNKVELAQALFLCILRIRDSTTQLGWYMFQFSSLVSGSSQVIMVFVMVPSGKHTRNYGKSPFSMGKSSINCHFQ
jgi:hypothetical protein